MTWESTLERELATTERALLDALLRVLPVCAESGTLIFFNSHNLPDEYQHHWLHAESDELFELAERCSRSAMNQVVPNPSERELSIITEALSLGKIRAMPYGANAIEIVSSGKSWQIDHASIELLAHAAAWSIRQSALDSGVTADTVSETSARGRVEFPKTILVDIDRTKR